MTKSTHELLRLWGGWARHPDLRMNVRCGIAIIIEANFGGTVGEQRISDDEALRVDRVIAQLKTRNPSLCRVLREAYVHDLSSREIGIKFGYDHKKALALLNQAIAWVDGALSQAEGEFIA